jgi:uncharacterized protein with HEPN domain
MPARSPKLLEHIRDAASFILQVTRGKELTDFENDRLLRQGVERNLEIIGEAVGRLSRDDPETAARIPDFRQIIAFRNILIHGYDILDHAKIWQVITHDLAPLESQVTELLAEHTSEQAQSPGAAQPPDAP